MKKLLLLLFPICAFAQSGNVDGSLRTVTATGTNNYVISGELLPTSYDPHERFIVIFTNANTGTSTLKRGNLSALPLQLPGGIDIVSGYIQNGERKIVSCTGTYYQIIGTYNLFTKLLDGPGSFSGQALNHVRVNIGGNALEYRTPSQVLSDIGAQGTISLTTTGTSGAATFLSNTLNIPQYQGAITLTNTGTSGTATLIGNTLNVPQYQGQLTLTTTGTSGAATLIGNTLNIPNYATGSGISGLTTGVVPYATSATTIGNSELIRQTANAYKLNGSGNNDVQFLVYNSSASGNSESATLAAVVDNGGSYAAIAMYSSAHSTLANKMIVSNTTSDIVILPSSTGKVAISNGTIITPARNLHSYFTDGTNTATVGYSNRMTKALSSGTPTAGIGVGMEFETQTTSGGTFKVGSTIESVSTNVGVGTESFDLVFKGMTSGSLVEKMRFTTYGVLTAGSTVYTPVDLGTVAGSTINDYAIGNGTVFKINATTSTVTVTGIAGGVEGRVILITDTGSTGVQFVDNSGSSTAGNRFSIPGSFTLAAGNSCQFAYVGGFWRLTSKTN